MGSEELGLAKRGAIERAELGEREKGGVHHEDAHLLLLALDLPDYAEEAHGLGFY